MAIVDEIGKMIFTDCMELSKLPFVYIKLGKYPILTFRKRQTSIKNYDDYVEELSDLGWKIYPMSLLSLNKYPFFIEIKELTPWVYEINGKILNMRKSKSSRKVSFPQILSEYLGYNHYTTVHDFDFRKYGDRTTGLAQFLRIMIEVNTRKKVILRAKKNYHFLSFGRFGIAESLVVAAKEYGMTPRLLQERLARGWSIDESLLLPKKVSKHQKRGKQIDDKIILPTGLSAPRN